MPAIDNRAATHPTTEYVLPTRPPARPVVVLREAELDCDLTTAIERVRGDSETAGNRILIVAADEREEAVAAPITQLDRGALATDALRRLGGRLVALLECQERFQEEFRITLEEMDASVVDESRARLMNQLRTAKEILDWGDAVIADLVVEARRAKVGQSPVDLGWLVRRVADAFAARSDVEVSVQGTFQPVWGDESSLTEMFGLALEIVHRRAGREGPITVEMGQLAAGAGVRILSRAEPHNFAAAKLVERFRQAVDEAGAGIETDPMGPAVAGMVVRLPFLDG